MAGEEVNDSSDIVRTLIKGMQTFERDMDRILHRSAQLTETDALDAEAFFTIFHRMLNQYGCVGDPIHGRWDTKSNSVKFVWTMAMNEWKKVYECP